MAKFPDAGYYSGRISSFLATAEHENTTKTLRQIGKVAEPQLLNMLRDHPDPTVRERVMLILRDIGTIASIYPLKEHAQKKNRKQSPIKHSRTWWLVWKKKA